MTLTRAELASMTGDEIFDLLAAPVVDDDDCDLFDDDDCGLAETLRRGEGCTSTEATRLCRFVAVAE